MIRRLVIEDNELALQMQIIKFSHDGWEIVPDSFKVQSTERRDYLSCEMVKELDPIIIGGEDDGDEQ